MIPILLAFMIQRVTVPVGDGASVAAIVVRPDATPAKRPATLIFTIYADPGHDVQRAEYGAARGYATIVAYSRGKAWGSGRIAPYENDGRDADRVISWIAKQPWSDGHVGMYGGSYEGFTTWAAAKYHNPALRTIVAYVANNPGAGLPMENNVFPFVNYGWVNYATSNRYLNTRAYGDPTLRTLNQRWFSSGLSYRSVPQLAGLANPWFEKWLDHPSFDAYWQSLVPYKSDFAKINVPVLTVTGYYDDGQESALNYLSDHARYNPHADDYLVIGPWDHFGTQRQHKPDPLRGYPIDAVAQINTPQLTYDWFDWMLRHGKRPALLEDRINYEVMGRNQWHHAASIASMAQQRQRLYLAPRVLASEKPAMSWMSQTIDFSDRKTVNGADYYPAPIIGAEPDFSRGLKFISQPLPQAMELSGKFSGRLVVSINKRDFDFSAVLYQELPNGQLMHLSYYMGRASYARDASKRELLMPGSVTTIDFDRSRMVSRYLEKGSRLILVVDGVKNGFAEINYGTGGDVATESIRDAKVPLQIRWASESYIDVPLTPL